METIFAGRVISVDEARVPTRFAIQLAGDTEGIEQTTLPVHSDALCGAFRALTEIRSESPLESPPVLHRLQNARDCPSIIWLNYP